MRTALLSLNVCHTNVAVLHGLAGLFGRLAGQAMLVGRLDRVGWLAWWDGWQDGMSSMVGWLQGGQRAMDLWSKKCS